MTCKLSVRLLMIGLLIALGCAPFSSVASAAGWFEGDDTPPAADPPSIVIDLEPMTPVVKQAIPTRQEILSLLQQGQIVEAEAAYLDFAAAWGDDDADLLAAVTMAMLQQQSSEGNEEAFVALIRSGDRSAMNLLRQMIRAGKSELAAENYHSAIRALASQRQSVDLPLLVGLLQHEDADIVNTAILALGDLGRPAAIDSIIELAGDADPQRSIQIVQSIIKIGGREQMRERYFSQLDFPLILIPERAAMLLALVGDNNSWGVVKKMIDEKWPKYYPVALSTIGRLDVDETEQYILDALKGNEQEQLAALQSIDALAPDTIDATLTDIMLDTDRSDNIRITAVQLLGGRGSLESESALRSVAFKISDIDPVIAPDAILALEKVGALHNRSVRFMIRQQLGSQLPEVALAARTALARYANNI